MTLWFVDELDKTERIRLGFTVAGMIIFVLLMWWLKSDIVQRTVAVQSKRKELAAQVQAATTGATLKIDFENARPFFAVLENMLPTKDLLLQLPKDLGEFAKQKGVGAFGIIFGAERVSENNAPGSVDITLSAQGAYIAITEFIRAVEHSRYLMKIKRVDFTERSGVYEAKILGEVYFR